MDPNLVDEVHSLGDLIDHLSEELETFDKKVDEIPGGSQQTAYQPVLVSAYYHNPIIKFLNGLCKLSPGELKSTVKEANTILNSINPIPRDDNCDETIEWNVDGYKLKTLMTRVFDILNMLPAHVTKVDANNPIASTSNQIFIGNDNSNEGEAKIQFWRRYKNKYNYIKKLRPILPPLDDQFNKVVTDVNAIVQNDVNDSTQKDGSDLNILNNKKIYTIEDIEQSEEVYELLKSKLKNSPYDHPFFKENVKDSIVTIPLHDGTTIVKPLSRIAPLILLTKCDNLLTIQLQNKKKMPEHFQSTSKQDLNKINDSNSNTTTEKITNRETRVNETIDLTNRMPEHFQSTSKHDLNKINDSNSNTTTEKITNRETRVNETIDLTNSFNTNVKTTTKKQRLATTIKKQCYGCCAIKNVKHKASKKRKH